MSDPTTQEPTMEDILASIRRIISEDDTPAGDASAETEAKAPEPFAAPEPVADPAPPPAEDVLELTEPAPPPAEVHETHGDLDVFTRSEPEPEPAPLSHASTPPPPEPEPAPRAFAPEPAAEDDEALIAPPTRDAAATHFSQLAKSIAMPAGGRTLEDVVRELLKPLLKDWLDQHLESIVEARVQDEVERISRRRV